MTFELILISVILTGLVVASAIKDWRNMKDTRELIDKHAEETRFLIDTIVGKHAIARAVARSVEKQAVPTVQTFAAANILGGQSESPKIKFGLVDSETETDFNAHLD